MEDNQRLTGDLGEALDTKKKEYETPLFIEVKLEGERAVLGACFTVSTGCDTYRY